MIHDIGNVYARRRSTPVVVAVAGIERLKRAVGYLDLHVVVASIARERLHRIRQHSATVVNSTKVATQIQSLP
jgi:hypothetical protein